MAERKLNPEAVRAASRAFQAEVRTFDEHLEASIRAYLDAEGESRVDSDLLRAVAYCCLGLAPAPTGDAFTRAKALGLLAQDSVWRATERGKGVLVAAGLLKGEPAPRRLPVTMLWAHSDRYPTHIVAVWSASLDEFDPNLAAEKRASSEREFLDLGDGEPWTFWTTQEDLDASPEPVEDEGGEDA